MIIAVSRRRFVSITENLEHQKEQIERVLIKADPEDDYLYTGDRARLERINLDLRELYNERENGEPKPGEMEGGPYDI